MLWLGHGAAAQESRLRAPVFKVDPAWPVIPMASAYERVSQERAPVGALLPSSSAAVQAVTDLWRRLEKALGGAK